MGRNRGQHRKATHGRRTTSPCRVADTDSLIWEKVGATYMTQTGSRRTLRVLSCCHLCPAPQPCHILKMAFFFLTNHVYFYHYPCVPGLDLCSQHTWNSLWEFPGLSGSWLTTWNKKVPCRNQGGLPKRQPVSTIVLNFQAPKLREH